MCYKNVAWFLHTNLCTNALNERAASGKVTIRFLVFLDPVRLVTLGSSNPNISRIPMNPSVACFTAEFNTLIDLEAFEQAVPTVEACLDATST